ncbi:hypothetical protein Tco_1535014 [Tanacetum coccineum]
MRTCSQSRNSNRKQQVNPTFVEPFHLVEPIPVVTMDDNRTMAQLLEAPTVGYDSPLVWPSITVDGVTRLKEYTELTPAKAIQADSKDLWEKIKLLMQGTSLTKQERECKLYDEFDKFTYKKGESLHEYYLRFTLLLNDMNIYKMPLEQFQVNTKFLNTLPDEWSKFVTDVKLVKDLHTTNVDQLCRIPLTYTLHIIHGSRSRNIEREMISRERNKREVRERI